MVTATLFEPARVWLRRGHLDRDLALGVDPSTDPALTRRAHQLSSRRCRRALAEGIRNLLDAAEAPSRAYSSAVPLARREILAERAMLLELVGDLTSDTELNARGVAMIDRLITDGESPIYAGSRQGGLRDALIHARAALHLV